MGGKKEKDILASPWYRIAVVISVISYFHGVKEKFEELSIYISVNATKIMPPKALTFFTVDSLFSWAIVVGMKCPKLIWLYIVFRTTLTPTVTGMFLLWRMKAQHLLRLSRCHTPLLGWDLIYNSIWVSLEYVYSSFLWFAEKFQCKSEVAMLQIPPTLMVPVSGDHPLKVSQYIHCTSVWGLSTKGESLHSVLIFYLKRLRFQYYLYISRTLSGFIFSTPQLNIDPFLQFLKFRFCLVTIKVRN